MSIKSLAELRRDYRLRALDEGDVHADPIVQFERWFDEAVQSEVLEVNAMTLATVSPNGDPAARIVLLKGADEHGFTFFTNYTSAKAKDLDAHPRASLLLFWAELERQVRITGTVTRVTHEESASYFRSRPRESQLGAWASPQSEVVADRTALEEAYARAEAVHAGGEVPCPPFWGGYRLSPERIEFWQGRPSRLHDRLVYVKGADGTWSRERLAP